MKQNINEIKRMQELAAIKESLAENIEISDDEIESAAVLKYRGDNFAQQRANSDKILAFEEGAMWYRKQLRSK